MWHDEFSGALDKANKPVKFLFRNDDAGWAENQLFKLLDCFSAYDTPIDLAVIPMAIDANKSSNFANRIINSNGMIGVHQHGHCHCNYQLQGRKCEFGNDRSYSQQKADIKAGRIILTDYFGDQLDNIFTPPWNRCNQDTINALIDLGFDALSRDNTATPLKCKRLREIPVNIDWFKTRNDIRLSYLELRQSIMQLIASGRTVNIMLHHEIMGQQERNIISDLLELLHEHPMANCYRMNDLLKNSTATDDLSVRVEVEILTAE
jgi:hypothetical protein